MAILRLPFHRYALWLDGIGEPSLVDDESNLVGAVTDLAKMTGLTLHSTQIARVGDDEQHGVSVQGLIVQSNIAIHGWRESGGIMCDVVSCKPWDYEAGRAFLIDRFKVLTVLNYMNTDMINRGALSSY